MLKKSYCFEKEQQAKIILKTEINGVFLKQILQHEYFVNTKI